MFRRLMICAVLITVAAVGLLAQVAGAAVASATIGSTNVFAAVPGATEPVGDVTVTESTVGELTVGDVVTVRLKDSAAAATLHLTSTPVVSGTNGLAGTLAVASSSGTLQDEVQVTITSLSTGSFPGVLTIAQLNPAMDAGTAIGNATATISDTGGKITTGSVNVANVISGGTLKASYVPSSQPTLAVTGSDQAAGSITIDEPAKDFFHTGDVITFRVRDASGSADTIGLTGTPSASGGAMSVTASGLNGSQVQPNETGFKVSVDLQDPSNGSASTLTVSNIALNTAQAPSGPITLTALVTSGGSAATEYIVPGRVTIANVGGNTTTSSAGNPVLAVPGAGTTTGEVGGDLTISAKPGALRQGDTFSLAIQEPGVTFTAAGPPLASLTGGNLALTAAAAQLDAGNITATWTVKTPNTSPTTIEIGPIYYDVASTATAGDKVGLKSSGDGSFRSQTVTNGKLVSATAGVFTAAVPPVSTSSASPAVEPGVDVHYTETGAGSLVTNNSAIVLLSPGASQIAAYRTTFTAAPTATVTGNLTLGAPIVNSQTVAVTTADGIVSAPPQTAVIYPVTAASTGSAAQVTFSGISYKLGNFVSPGALLATGSAVSGTGVVTAASTAVSGTAVGNAVVDVINGNGLGSAAAGDTTPPETYLDSGPADGSTVFSGTVTFVFHSSEDPFATFTCILISHPDAGDASTTIENNCGQPSDTQPVTYSKTYPSLANGQYSFYVQATDAANNTDPTPATTSFGVGVDNTAPTASIGTPKTAGAPVIVTFSEPVKSIGAADVSVTPSANVALSCFNGAAAADCLAGPVTTLAIKPGRAFTPGQSYNVELDPAGAIAPITDTAGNPLADTNATFRSSLKEEETSAAATFSWRKVSATSASGGSYAEDNRAGATASYTFTGTSVSWSTITGPNQGKATVLVDGAKKLAVNNYAKTTRYGVVRSVSGLSNAAHTITVVVSGTKGAAGATDTQVAIDSFVAGATTVQNTAPAVRYTWQNVKASKASGHRYAAAATRGDSVSFVFAGTGVTWQTVTSRAMGKATVSIDGKKKATVDNYSSATKYGVKRHYGGLSAGVHTLTIKVLGHRRSASTANTVAVDRWTVT